MGLDITFLTLNQEYLESEHSEYVTIIRTNGYGA